MKTFKQYIAEILTPTQHTHVLRLVSRTRDVSFSDRMFGGADNHTIILPFEHAQQTHHDSVVGVLDKHGYDIVDYKKGLAVRRGEETINQHGFKTKKRPISIGSLLQKKHPDVTEEMRSKAVDDFNKRETGDYEIMISRHPIHVAEQSTNKDWRSCLTLGSCSRDHPSTFEAELRQLKGVSPNARDIDKQQRGQHSSFVENDINAGTHIAYLIRKGDHELRNPLGRLTFKPHTMRSPALDQDPVVLRPEPKSYVSGSLISDEKMKKAFETQAIKHVEENHNSHQPLGEYEEDRAPRPGFLEAPPHGGKMYSDHDSSHRGKYFNVGSVSEFKKHMKKLGHTPQARDVISKILKYTPNPIHGNFTHYRLTPGHIDHILDTYGFDQSNKEHFSFFAPFATGMKAISHPDASHDNVRKFLSHALPYAQSRSDMGSRSELSDIQRMFSEHHNLPKDVFDSAFSNPMFKEHIIRNPHLSGEHIHRIIDDADEHLGVLNYGVDGIHFIKETIKGYKNLDESHMLKILSPEHQKKSMLNRDITDAILSHPNVTQRVREAAVNHPNKIVRMKALQPIHDGISDYKHADEGFLHKVMREHEDHDVAEEAYHVLRQKAIRSSQRLGNVEPLMDLERHWDQAARRIRGF